MAKQMSFLSSADEFIHRFVVADPGQKHTPFGSRQVIAFKKEVDDVTVSLAPQEGCHPRDTVVAIPPDPDPNVFLWPTCVSVKRCGGCCAHSSLECIPTLKSHTTVQVLKTILLSGPDDLLKASGIIDIVLEYHGACDCVCRVRPSDCNMTLQRYDADTCQCQCLTVTSCMTPKRWDPMLCSCVCPRILNCLNDEYFNYSSCTCRRFTQSASVADPRQSESAALPASATSAQCPGLHCLPGYERISKVGSRCICSPLSAPKNINKRSPVRIRPLRIRIENPEDPGVP